MGVLVTCPLPGAAGECLAASGLDVDHLGDVGLDEAVERGRLDGVHGIVCTLTDRIDARVFDAAPHLTAIATVSVGHDHIDTELAARRGIQVITTPGALDDATADLAMLLLLAASRRSTEAEADLRSGRWSGWDVDQYLGMDLAGATLGVVGWGRIGRAVARRAEAFGMDVIHHGRRATGEAGYVADLDHLLAQSDAVSLHVPSTPDTHHLIDERRLALLRPTAVLVNTARGSVVDEAALADALHDRRLFGAGLDVFEREPVVHPRLLTAPGVTVLPHIGSATIRTRSRMAEMAVDGLLTSLGVLPSNSTPHESESP
ncbi:MAG: D-glycerate dehydrogenase [Acidimicrobiaceae bacterium]|nr:D-glycerate dehydrogenase [Acidimicrobiaceae bacterium]